MRPLVGFLVVLCAAWWTVAAPLALAQTGANQPGATKDVAGLVAPRSIECGFAGRYKLGFWTPVRLTFAAGTLQAGDKLQLRYLDGDALPLLSSPHEVSAADAQLGAVTLYARPGRLDGLVSVRHRRGEQSLETPLSASQRGTPLTATGWLLAQIGPPLTMNRLAAREAAAEPVGIAQLTDTRSLPDAWYGYDGLDVLMLVSPSQESLRATPPQVWTAIDEWVGMGGRLVVAVGRDAPQLLSAGEPLQRFTPGQFERLAPLTNVGVWPAWIGSSLRIEANLAAGGAATLDVPLLRDVRGKIEVFQGTQAQDLPLLVRQPRGFGQVIFIAADLHLPPLSTWSGRQQLYAALLARDFNAPLDDKLTALRSAGLGFDDMSGQLRGALDQFPGVELVPFWFVGAAGLVYVLLLFPGEYWGVTRLARRPLLTWIVFPSLLVGLCAASYWFANHAKGDVQRQTRAAIVDVDVSSGLVRATAWSGVFSPANERYEISLPKLPWPAERSTPRLSWYGMPGRGLGGMEAPVSAGASSTAPYLSVDNGRRLERVPISVWSSKQFRAQWRGAHDASPDLPLVREGDMVFRTNVRNPYRFTLTRCVLLYGRWAYPLGDLAPEEGVSIPRDPRTAEAWLTERGVVRERQRIEPYDRETLEVERILPIIGFYQAAGGRKYVGLLNRYEQALDMSEQLEMGRAVLMGWGEAPPAITAAPVGAAPAAPEPATTKTLYRHVYDVRAAN
jgi:hypothetical protein